MNGRPLSECDLGTLNDRKWVVAGKGGGRPVPNRSTATKIILYRSVNSFTDRYNVANEEGAFAIARSPAVLAVPSHG